LTTHSFIASKSPKAKRLPSLFVVFLQRHLRDRANKMHLFVSKKITNFVFPVLPHLWRMKKGVQWHPMAV
jgi:hypothetical protein